MIKPAEVRDFYLRLKKSCESLETGPETIALSNILDAWRVAFSSVWSIVDITKEVKYKNLRWVAGSAVGVFWHNIQIMIMTAEGNFVKIDPRFQKVRKGSESMQFFYYASDDFPDLVLDPPEDP